MARTADELLAQIERFVPAQFREAEPLLAGIAGAMALAEASGETLEPLGTIGDGEGKWLTLQGHGLGVHRASGESDDSLRIRLRLIEDKVTKPAIEAAVNAILDPDTCTVIEWSEGPYLDNEADNGAWLDNTSCRLSGGPNSFLVLIPPQGTEFDFGAFLDYDLWLDSDEAVLGDAPQSPIYAVIESEINRIKAAGVFWRLVLEG